MLPAERLWEFLLGKVGLRSSWKGWDSYSGPEGQKRSDREAGHG